MFNQIERDVLGQNCLSGFNQWCLIVRKTPSKFLGEFMGEIFCSKEECYGHMDLLMNGLTDEEVEKVF